MACLAASRALWAILYAAALDLLAKSPLNCMLFDTGFKKRDIDAKEI
jgi:hypothetical protein